MISKNLGWIVALLVILGCASYRIWFHDEPRPAPTRDIEQETDSQTAIIDSLTKLSRRKSDSLAVVRHELDSLKQAKITNIDKDEESTIESINYIRAADTDSLFRIFSAVRFPYPDTGHRYRD